MDKIERMERIEKSPDEKLFGSRSWLESPGAILKKKCPDWGKQPSLLWDYNRQQFNIT